jgi:hypothetical protein
MVNECLNEATWIDVDSLLPEDNETLLVLVLGIFVEKKSPLNMSPTTYIFEGRFHRCMGWHIRGEPIPKGQLVIAWMKRPADPQDIVEKRSPLFRWKD